VREKTPKAKFKTGDRVTNAIDTGVIINKPEWDKIPGEERECWWYQIQPDETPEWNWIWCREEDLILLQKKRSADEERSEAA